MNMSNLVALGRALLRIAEKMGNRVGGREFTFAEIVVLARSYHHERATITDLVRETGLAQSYVSTTVRGLAEEGVLILEVDPGDRRRTIVRIADDVRAYMTSLKTASIADELREVFAVADEEDLARIISLLEELVAHVDPAVDDVTILRDRIA